MPLKGSKKFQPVGVAMAPSKTEFGKFIRARRLELNLQQTVLNQRIPRASGTNRLISQLETGARKYVYPDQLDALAKELQVEPEELRKYMAVRPGSQPRTELGRLIRSRREELGLSLSAFATKMSMTLQKAKALEVKKSPTIRYGMIQQLADTLELHPSVLVPFVGITRKGTESKLGRLVRNRRKELGMTTSMLAERLSVSRQWVDRIEFETCCLSNSNEMIVKLAQILALDVNKLEAVRPARKLRETSTTSPLGRFLIARRLELHLSQREVAKRVEISQSFLSSVEKGQRRASPCLLDKLTKVLDCHIPPELIVP